MQRTIGVIDYGVGNVASVCRSLGALGYRTRLSYDRDALDEVDLLLLPGVGAFPAAMEALRNRGLVDYLKKKACTGTPIVGICLGMQLLADASSEYNVTPGLGLIPGEVKPIQDNGWHIGWNTIEVLNQHALLQPSDGQSVYFNHSFAFSTAPEFQVAVARAPDPIVAAVRRHNVVGLQFHPEKSQLAGRALLRNVIEGLCYAK